MNSPETKQPINLTYQEREALHVIKKLLKRKPEVMKLLMQDMVKASAVEILLQAKKEMSDLHILAQAMVSAAGEIVKMDKEKAPCEPTT